MSDGGICLACGLCCNGTLFERTMLDEAELTVISANGLAVERHDGRPAFAQPCPRHDAARGCTIYAERPRSCRAFRCTTLREMEGGTITRTEAMRRIGEAHDAHARLTASQPPGETIVTLRQRWPEGVGMPATPQSARTRLAMVALTRVLRRYFAD